MICDLHDLLEPPDADFLETMTPQGRQRDVEDPAHTFDARCRKAGAMAYVITKKTVLKGQKGFGQKTKEAFDADSEPMRPARKGNGPGPLEERPGVSPSGRPGGAMARAYSDPDDRESSLPLASSPPRASTVGWKPWAHANSDEPKARPRNGEQQQQPGPQAGDAREPGLRN